MVVFADFSTHLFWDPGSGHRLRSIFRTIAASEMIVVTIMADLTAAYYRVHIYSRVADPCL